MFGHQDKDIETTTAPVVSNQPSLTNRHQSTTPTISSDGPTDRLTPTREALSPAGGYPILPSQKIQAGGSDDDLVSEQASPPPPPPSETAPTANETNDLDSIRQQVITELFPLIDQLDQTPEERYRTLMMMIQATDNQTLIKAAYEAAHNIGDVKTKAQALLDIINEINYFTLPKT